MDAMLKNKLNKKMNTPNISSVRRRAKFFEVTLTANLATKPIERTTAIIEKIKSMSQRYRMASR